MNRITVLYVLKKRLLKSLRRRSFPCGRPRDRRWKENGVATMIVRAVLPFSSGSTSWHREFLRWRFPIRFPSCCSVDSVGTYSILSRRPTRFHCCCDFHVVILFVNLVTEIFLLKYRVLCRDRMPLTWHEKLE